MVEKIIYLFLQHTIPDYKYLLHVIAFKNFQKHILFIINIL
jgi:hypothetical protein